MKLSDLLSPFNVATLDHGITHEVRADEDGKHGFTIRGTQ